MSGICVCVRFVLSDLLAIYLTCLLALCLGGVDGDGREGHVVRFYEGVFGWVEDCFCPVFLHSVWRTNVGGRWEMWVVGSSDKREGEAALLFPFFLFHLRGSGWWEVEMVIGVGFGV